MKLQAVLSPRRAFFLSMPARPARLVPLRVARPAPPVNLASMTAERSGTQATSEAFAPEEIDFLRRLREAGL